jgi:uncharacterized protein (DUF433 family)
MATTRHLYTDETTIHETPGVCGGYPCIGNTRIPVRVVVEASRAYGNVDAIATSIPQLSRDQIEAALAYFRDFPSRVDEGIATNIRAYTDFVAHGR